jgi:hypothetical protein
MVPLANANVGSAKKANPATTNAPTSLRFKSLLEASINLLRPGRFPPRTGREYIEPLRRRSARIVPAQHLCQPPKTLSPAVPMDAEPFFGGELSLGEDELGLLAAICE